MIFGSKFSLLSMPAGTELGFLTTLTSPLESEDTPGLPGTRGPLPQGSSTQVTLSRLSVKPREMPTTTGPTGRSRDSTIDSLISTERPGGDSKPRNRPQDLCSVGSLFTSHCAKLISNWRNPKRCSTGERRLGGGGYSRSVIGRDVV